MNQANLRDQLATHFNDSELNDLCFDLNIDYQNLPGQTKQEKARELIIYCQRHGLLENLIIRCQEMRPHLSWEYNKDTHPVIKEVQRAKRINPVLIMSMIIGTLVIVIGGIMIANLIQDGRFTSTLLPIDGNEGFIENTLTPPPTLLPLSSSADPTNSIAATSMSASPTPLSLPVQLPDGPTVMIVDSSGNKFQYTILSAQREPLSSDSYLLHLRIRAWTDSGQGMGFWNDSFRLVDGDLRLAPVNYLNELVERDETVDGDIEFEIDASLAEAVLVIHYRSPEDTKDLRLIFP